MSKMANALRRSACPLALAVAQLAAMPQSAGAEEASLLTHEILDASPLEIWRDFLRQEEEQAVEAAAALAAAPPPDPDDAPAPGTPYADRATLSPAPPAGATPPAPGVPAPVPAAPTVAMSQGIALPAPAPVAPVAAVSHAPAPPAPLPAATVEAPNRWSPLVVVHEVAAAPPPQDHAGWVAHLRGPVARADTAPSAALRRTGSAVAWIDAATGIEPPAEPVFALLETPPAVPAPGTLTRAAPHGPVVDLPTLIDRVLEDDLEVRIGRARTLERGYNVRTARAGGRPTVSLVAAGGPSLDMLADDDASLLNSKAKMALTLDYTLLDFGRSRYEVLQAQRSLDSAEAATLHEANEKVYEVLDTLLRVGQVGETTRANESHLIRLEELRALIAANATEGNATTVDVRRVDSRIEATRSGLIGLRSQRANAVSGFRRLTGLEADSVDFSPLYLRTGLPGEVGAADVVANPEIRAIDAEIASLAAQKEAVRRGRLPNLSLRSGVNYNTDDMFGEEEDTFDADVSLQLSFDLYDGGASAGRRGQLRAQRTEAELRRLRKLRKIEEEAENIATFTRSQDEKTGLLEDRVRSLESVAALYRDQFGIGARTVFEMLESEADLLAARIELTAHIHERARSTLQKRRLGGDLIGPPWSDDRA